MVGGVQVYTMRLDVSDERLASFERTLVREELERADQFAFAVTRRRFVASRAFLRALLGHALGERPERVRIEVDANGKPRVGGPLSFNLAHSHDLAVAALAEREVGVDVERLRSLARRDAIAAEILSRRELAELEALPETERDAALLAAWTRKESYLKAVGLGLALPPREVPVDARWSTRTLAPAPGYVGALTVAR
jgi:4'-phosphopantetheinyl transferase